MESKGQDVAKKLLEDLKKSVPKAKRAKLPGNIAFRSDGAETVVMELMRTAAGLDDPQNRKKAMNMQKDDAAFEAWALILHAHLGKKIVLSVEKGTLPTTGSDYEALNQPKGKDGYPGTVHYHRFLYRVLKFQEQFGGPNGWFSVEEDIQDEADRVKNLLCQYKLSNNLSEGQASSEPGSKGVEKKWEQYFTSPESPLCADGQKVYSQLPVGLFHIGKEMTSKDSGTHRKNAIFSGKGSAIDLWKLSEDEETLKIYELKAQNAMVGIITELMFYANYCRDMYIDHSNNWHPIENKEGYRGYSRLSNLYYGDKHLKKIEAYMLTDRLHPLIDQKVIDCMDKNAGIICYDYLKYDEKGNISQEI